MNDRHLSSFEWQASVIPWVTGVVLWVTGVCHVSPGTNQWCSSWRVRGTCGVACGRRPQWDSWWGRCAADHDTAARTCWTTPPGCRLSASSCHAVCWWQTGHVSWSRNFCVTELDIKFHQLNFWAAENNASFTSLNPRKYSQICVTEESAAHVSIHQKHLNCEKS